MIKIEPAGADSRLIRNGRKILGWIQIAGVTWRGDLVSFDPRAALTAAELREIAKLMETRK